MTYLKKYMLIAFDILSPSFFSFHFDSSSVRESAQKDRHSFSVVISFKANKTQWKILDSKNIVGYPKIYFVVIDVYLSFLSTSAVLSMLLSPLKRSSKTLLLLLISYYEILVSLRYFVFWSILAILLSIFVYRISSISSSKLRTFWMLPIDSPQL